MRMRKIFIIAFIIVVNVLNTSASLRIPTYAGNKNVESWEKTDATKTEIKKGRYFVAFTSPLDQKIREICKNEGIRISGSAGKIGKHYVYIFILPKESDFVSTVLKKQNSFYNIVQINPDDKVPIQLREKTERSMKTGELLDLIVFLDSLEKETLDDINRLSVKMNEYPDYYKSYRILVTPQSVQEIASLMYVQEIQEYKEKEYTLEKARQLTLVDSLQKPYFTKQHPPTQEWLRGVPNTGDSIWICINEQSRSRHLDFYELNVFGDTILRTLDTNWWGLSVHGTHVAGIAAGNGWLSHERHFITSDTLAYRGVAPKALVLPRNEKGDVNNHSFTEGSQGFYNATSRSHDARLSNHSKGDSTLNNVGVWAAANNGWRPQYGNQRGYYSMLVNNKNGIKVGASEKTRPVIWHKSSMGPTRDGRVGPDVVAPGTGAGDMIYDIEIDSIALKNNGTKVYWNFDDGEPSWGAAGDIWNIWNIDHSSGTIKFNARAGSYFFSDPIFPGDTAFSDPDDTLLLRIKAVDTVYGNPENMKMRLYVKSIDSVYVDSNVAVSFTITADGNWHDVHIPLTDTSITRQHRYTWGQFPDSILKLRLDFGTTHSGIVSTRVNSWGSEYEGESGTSMACPHVTGIVALMLQKYRDSVLVPRNISSGTDLSIHDNPFWNSTARAIIVHTATDMVDTIGLYPEPRYNPDFVASGNVSKTIYTEGPDWVTGYGLVNALKAVEYVDTLRFKEDTINQGSTKISEIHVTDSSKNLRVTLCWDDPGNVLVSESDAYRTKLINNLDLLLRHPESGREVRPWVLDHSGMCDVTIDTLPSNGLDSAITPDLILAKKAFRGIDTTNNLEVVDVVNPDTGIWEIVVAAQSIIEDQSNASGINQEYSLVSDIPFIQEPVQDTVDLVMGFEQSSLWYFYSGSGLLSNDDSVKTEGNASMQIQGNGWQQINSVDLRTTELDENNKVALDFYVGDNQPNPNWYGYLQLYVSCPSAGIYNIYIGQEMLTPLTLNEYSTLSFNLPVNVLTALAGDYDDFSFSIAINTNPGSGPYYFDNMRFTD